MRSLLSCGAAADAPPKVWALLLHLAAGWTPLQAAAALANVHTRQAAVSGHAPTVEPIVRSDVCHNASRIFSEAGSVTDGGLYVTVRHMGAPGTAELLEEVATPIQSWDVGSVTGVHVPAGLRNSTQRGFKDNAGKANAFQLDCSFGSFIDTSSFNHSVPIRGGGQNVVYTAAFPSNTAPRPWSDGHPSTKLVLHAVAGVPTMELDPYAGHTGVGQLSFGFYLHDGTSGKVFCFILQMFDSRPPGTGNGQEVIASDTFTPFVSTPLLYGMKYSTVATGSATLHNQHPFPGMPFRVSVSSAQLGAAIAAINREFTGTNLGVDLEQYRLSSVMILHEVLLVAGTNALNNVKMGVGIQNFSVSVERNYRGDDHARR